MIKILFLDQDALYCRRVCSQINLKAKYYKSYDQYDYFEDTNSLTCIPGKLFCDNSLFRNNCREVIDLSASAIDWNSTLVIYNPSQFYNPPENSNSMMLFESLLAEIPGSDAGSICHINKYCSLTAMLDKIDMYLQSHPSLMPSIHENNLICAIGAACPEMRSKELASITLENLEKGMKVARLDLCPPYFSDFPVSDSTGNSLSDAFLRLMADDLSFEDFGLFLVPKPDGSLQFRPFERADDLFECKPEHFRLFTELLLKWISHTNNQYLVIINCYAIPFSSVYTIAVLCDQLILINQDKISTRTNSYNKELGYLLSNLPTSCDVREMLLTCPA